MSASTKATQWPNKLGWTIKTYHGEAEVRDLVSKLRCFVPISPLFGEERYRRKDFPLGTCPKAAVAETATSGVIYSADTNRPL